MLQVIGKLEVSQSAKEHRFVVECQAVTKVIECREKCGSVVGTENTKQPELYGWKPNVLPHVDNTGFVYFMPIVVNGGNVCAGDFETQIYSDLPLECGTVYRLDDRVHHWTTDDSHTVCLFVGSYDAPDDTEAMILLSKGLAALAAGEYYGAPRAGRGFRVVLHDECLIETRDGYDYKLLADASRDDDFILKCSQGDCCKPAVIADRYFPYFQENNRCADHIRTDKIDRI